MGSVTAEDENRISTAHAIRAYVLLGVHYGNSFSQFLEFLDYRVAILRISDSFAFFF